MTLSTYSELKTSVISKLARSDLSSLIQDFVKTAEFFIFRNLRVKEMENVASPLTATDGVLALPADFLAVGELRLANNLRVELNYKPSKQLFRYEDEAFGSGYGYWDQIGANVFIRPKPSDSQEYWLKYFAKPLALIETDQETNAVFPSHADCYLYGALWQGFEHVRNFELSTRYERKMIDAIGQYNARYVEEKEGEGVLTVSAPNVA